MRSISFGPTSYHESHLQRHSEDENDETQNLQQNPPERIPSYSSQGNTSSRMSEVIFYSSENLFRESFVGHRELAMKKYCKCKFSFDAQRSFQSYCFEFCGLLNIQMNDVKFYLANREVPLSRLVRKPCVIEVYNAGSNSNKSGINSLQPAFKELLEKGIYSDIEIVVNGESIRAHKCILIARSEKFKAMIESQMRESIENRVEIQNKEITPKIYRLLIQWIYEGECDLPDSVLELITLLKLTDEYLLPDLQKVCEDQIVDTMDGIGAVEILTNLDLVLPVSSDQSLKEAAKAILLEDYETLEKQMPDIEERISKVKGLMSELFVYKKKQKSNSKRRKNSILADDAQKKKVRFNISSTIYEEASAIQDESDSLIEPLSIYSNNSPPGELINDEIIVSSTHSSLHVTERRHSANASQQYNSINVPIHHQGTPQDQIRTQHIDGARGLNRPASAGRTDTHSQDFRRNSDIDAFPGISNSANSGGSRNHLPESRNLGPSGIGGSGGGSYRNTNFNRKIMTDRDQSLLHSYLPEVKRFISYYSTCIYYQKSISEESKQMKERLNSIYQELLLDRENSNQPFIVQLVNALVDNVKENQILSSIWKASIKTLMKLLQYPQVVEQLKQSSMFDIQQFVLTFLEAKFDPIDQNEEEQKLVLLQKILFKITKTFILTEDYQFRIFKYMMTVLKKKTIDDVDSYYSSQFSDSTKKSLHKLLYHLMGEDEEHQVKTKIFSYIFAKIKKTLPLMSEKKNQSNLKIKEYLCFLIKTLEDCFKKIPSPQLLQLIIIQLKKPLIEITCMCAEYDDIMIRIQAQQLFTFLLLSILDQKMPLREELEIMLVKIILKPAFTLAKKLGSQDLLSKSSMQASTPSQAQVSLNSSSGVGGISTLNESDYENEDFIQVVHERTVQEDILLELNMNYILETLLLLKPDQLSQLFLMYDCQPFSENFITKSILMVLKYAQKSPSQYINIFRQLITRFQSFTDFGTFTKNATGSVGGPQMIQYMLEQKAQNRKLVKEVNHKYKVFLKKIDDMYSYVDPSTPGEVASKILVYSRDVQIDKIAEVIGGKDDKAKKLLQAYLDKMDYQGGDIEQSLRKFLQTYRLAGVDSQVVLRILELFSHIFFYNDSKKTFATKEEAYEFAYLIIVLQTCQHNPSVKNKTDLASFIESAHNICPKSKDTLPEGYFENIFHSVSKYPFYAPNSRSLIEENVNPYTFNEIDIRLSKVNKQRVMQKAVVCYPIVDQQQDQELKDDAYIQKYQNENENSLQLNVTESEFINAADLTQKQLFHYSNTTCVPPSLIALGAKHLLSFLTHRFLKFLLSSLNTASPAGVTGNNNISAGSSSALNSVKDKTSVSGGNMAALKFSIMVQMINLNKQFMNYEIVDKMFQVLYKVVMSSGHTSADHDQSMHSQLESMLWENFEHIKRSLILLPKLSISSFIVKEEIKSSLRDTFKGVLRVIELRQQEKRKQKNSGTGQKKEGTQPANRSQSFFDLVYNYFTENAEEDSQDQNEETKELEILYQIKQKILMEDKDGDYMENIEEKFDEKIGAQWMKEKSRLQELIGLICSQVRENFSQEEGLLCLAFLEHILTQSGQSLEVIEKLWVEMHLLVSFCLKTKPQYLNLSTNSAGSSKEEVKFEYEVISTDTSQDSIDHGSHLQPAELDLFTKESCSIKTKIYEASNRHLTLQLHLRLSKQIMNLKQDNHHVVRDVQRMISSIIEDPADKNHQHYKIVDDMFIFQQLTEFINPHQDELQQTHNLRLRNYPKISKLLRLMLIFLFKSQSKKLENDQQSSDLLHTQLLFFKGITLYLCDLSTQIPYDLINLSLDVFSKIHLQKKNCYNQEIIFDLAITVLENLAHALSKQRLINDETRFDLWFKIVQMLQEKIIFNSQCKKLEMVTIQAFNTIKNIVLNHPFAVEQQNFKQIRKLFGELLYRQTFESLNNSPLTQVDKSNFPKLKHHKEENKSQSYKDEDVDSDDESLESQVEQMCQRAVNNLSDIFIYYTAIIFKDGPQSESDANNDEQPSTESETNHQLLAYLWLNLLKVLLHYAEQANQRDFHTLILCVHDNIKRVIEFLIQQEILIENSTNQERAKLWKTSWEIVSAFFKDMKSQIISTKSITQKD